MNCLFTNGVELIPDHEYCAPKNITQNVTAIVDCQKADKDQCGRSYLCAWRKGKSVLNNTQLVQDSFLFESNFCHPATAENWDMNAPTCVS
jgi:hypothetical protein